ncbi:DUF3455 domain-containing protein [Streptomyces sp. NPDC005480]|uniref:DUF3455 domain-containing protein n=1 Tax=Streptomyces sp. NPDC005480 TaxID=3154880 RepID=UPI0033B7AAD6
MRRGGAPGGLTPSRLTGPPLAGLRGPELDLRATQSCKRHGPLSGTAEILRLNTVGGVAPAGSCDAGAVVGVPYRADYVFVQR